MTARSFLLHALAITTLSACDCLRVVSAVVLEAGTNEPIDGVEIRERHGDGSYEESTVVTGNDGAFEFSDISGGFRCPDVQLHFSKPGCVPVDLSFPPGTHGDTVYLRVTR